MQLPLNVSWVLLLLNVGSERIQFLGLGSLYWKSGTSEKPVLIQHPIIRYEIWILDGPGLLLNYELLYCALKQNGRVFGSF